MAVLNKGKLIQVQLFNEIDCSNFQESTYHVCIAIFCLPDGNLNMVFLFNPLCYLLSLGL